MCWHHHRWKTKGHRTGATLRGAGITTAPDGTEIGRRADTRTIEARHTADPAAGEPVQGAGLATYAAVA